MPRHHYNDSKEGHGYKYTKTENEENTVMG